MDRPSNGVAVDLEPTGSDPVCRVGKAEAAPEGIGFVLAELKGINRLARRIIADVFAFFDAKVASKAFFDAKTMPIFRFCRR